MIILMFSFISFLKADLIIGEAFLNDKLVYIEKHSPRINKDGQYTSLRTEYFYPNSKKRFAEIISTFTKNNFLPDVYFYDERSETEEEILYNKELNNLNITRIRDNKKEETKIDIKNPAIHGQGFHNFLLTNFDSIRKNKMTINIAVTARSDYYQFNIEKHKENDREIEFIVYPKNIFLRQIVKNIKMKYSLADKKLLKYSGPSNLSDEFGNGQDVDIQYKYL